MFEYVVTIEGHQVVAEIANFWPCHLYIDDDLQDTYDPNAYNPWDPDILWGSGLFSLNQSP
jgi:hypothetical protein